MGNIGTPELIIGLVIVFLLFGAKRMPEVARGLGRSLKIFKTEMQATPPKDDTTVDAAPARVATPPALPATDSSASAGDVSVPSTPTVQPVADPSRRDD